MAKFRVQFRATIEREVEVPDDLVWYEAYDFVREKVGWFEIAHSPAAKITIDTDRVCGFERLTPLSPELQARIDAVPQM